MTKSTLKVIDYLSITDDSDISKREGIELVEVYPGRWDININDRPTNKKIRQSEITYIGGHEDTLFICIGNMKTQFSIENVLTTDIHNQCTDIRILLKNYKFSTICIDKVIEYFLKAVEINKKYRKEISND